MCAAMKEHPRYNIVSVRISDDENQLLRQLQKQTLKSVSEIMREAIRLMMPEPSRTPTPR
jgi:predicted DNA-binding protein